MDLGLIPHYILICSIYMAENIATMTFAFLEPILIFNLSYPQFIQYNVLGTAINQTLTLNT